MTAKYIGSFRRGWLTVALAAAVTGLGGQAASAQTYGLATMQPGTLAHTVASAIAKTLKEKGGLNTLVQNTAGESVLIPMVAKGEIDLGMANMLEVVEGIETGKLQNDLRIIGSIYVLRMGFFTRKDSGIVNMADVKGKRVPAGYPAPDYSMYGPPAQKTNSMAIASLVASLVGFLCWLGSIAGIVLGIVAMNQIKQNREQGHGLAVAGIAIGAVSLIVGFIFMVVAFSS